MNVVVAAVSSNRSMSGVSRHAANLVRCLLLRSEITVLHLLVAPWEYGFISDAISRSDSRLRIHSVPLRPGTLRRNLWYYRELPAIAQQLSADIVHLAYPCPLRPGAFRCPAIVTLHDLYPYDIPSNFGFPKVFLNRMILRQSLRAAAAIACVSDATKFRLGIRLPMLLPKATTIYNCVDAGSVAVKPGFMSTWRNEPFFLCAAQHRRNKNVPIAIRAFKKLLERGQIGPDSRLLIIGLPGPDSGRIRRLVRAFDLGQRIVFVEGLSDAELTWCYRHCELLIAPSSHEGFGLPIAEAQLAGCRVVCSDIPAFREVAGPGCTFVTLTENADEDFASAMAQSLNRRRPAPTYFSQFALPAISEQYMRLYKQVLLPDEGLNARRPSIEQAACVPQTESCLAHKLPTTAGS